MHSLRTRLIAAFVIATVLPLAATIAITMSLLESSLGYATTEELDGLSRTLEETVRQFYQREREALRQDAAMGRSAPTAYAVADISAWPDDVRAFWESAEPERFGLSGPDGDRLDFMRRTPQRRRGLRARPGRHPHAGAVHEAAPGARGGGLDRSARPAARLHADAAPPRGHRLAHLAGAAALHRAPDQQADSPADRRTHRLCRRRLGPPRRIEPRTDEVGTRR